MTTQLQLIIIIIIIIIIILLLLLLLLLLNSAGFCCLKFISKFFNLSLRSGFATKFSVCFSFLFVAYYWPHLPPRKSPVFFFFYAVCYFPKFEIPTLLIVVVECSVRCAVFCSTLLTSRVGKNSPH